ncbi:unnamed protein product [Closterium sp. NIES-64]|nr:unnamed protein product [Closterium sp. NIES-64]
MRRCSGSRALIPLVLLLQPIGAELVRAEPGGDEPGGAEFEGAEPGGTELEGAEPVGAEPEGGESGGAEFRGIASARGPPGPAAGGPAARGIAAGGAGARGTRAASRGGTGGAGVTGLEVLVLEVLKLPGLVVLQELEVLVVLALLVPEVLVLEVLELPVLVVLFALELETLELEALELEVLDLEALELETLELEVLALGVLELEALELETLEPEVLALGVLELVALELEVLELEALELETLELEVLVLGVLEKARVPLPSPPASSLADAPDPQSDLVCAASPTVTCLLATVVTDPSFESTAASALVAELLEFAAPCRLDYATSLVAESQSVGPSSVESECALRMDVLEERQEDSECLAAVVPHLVSMLLALEGDPDALDIPTLHSYAEAITGPYSSQWQTAMDVEMASWKSTGTYVNAVPPPGANIVDGMWIFRVKRPPGSPPVFKARYLVRGYSQRQEVDNFQTFSTTPKMTTLWVLLHVAA